MDYNRDPGSHLWLKPRTYGVYVCARVCTSISMQWDSPSVPEWWSDLFSYPLSLAGISKDYCLLISKGAAGYLQVLGELCPSSTSPVFISFCWNWTFKYVSSTTENPRLRGVALPQKPCLDFSRLSVVMSHLFHLGLDKTCFHALQTPCSLSAQHGQLSKHRFNIKHMDKKNCTTYS